jgi:hypothetical protein
VKSNKENTLNLDGAGDVGLSASQPLTRLAAPSVNASGIRHIPLTRGKFAIVDDFNYYKVCKYSWRVYPTKYTCYALSFKDVLKSRYETMGKNRIIKRENIHMHKLLLDAPEGFEVDHINGNGLDNRMCNLRIATRSQNMMNKRKAKGKKYGYKGIFPLRNKFRAEVIVNGEKFVSESFVNAIDAARKYDEMALIHHGEFAKTNKMLGLIS